MAGTQGDQGARIGPGRWTALAATAAILVALVSAAGAPAQAPYEPYGEPPPPKRERCGKGVKPTIRGTRRGDFLRGTRGSDVIFARGGSDNVIGRGGADLICLGGGVDQADGGGGADLIAGGGRLDLIASGPGPDGVAGDRGPDIIGGELGSDIVVGGAGRDTVSFETKKLGVYVDLAKGRAYGQGSDVLNGVENVIGSPVADIVLGSPADNAVIGSSGDDHVTGGEGRDTLVGFLGVDTVDGGPQVDECSAEQSFNCERVFKGQIPSRARLRIGSVPGAGRILDPAGSPLPRAARLHELLR